jgi:hypothetical protein
VQVLPIEREGLGRGGGAQAFQSKAKGPGSGVLEDGSMVRILSNSKKHGGDVDQARAQHIEKLTRATMSGTASAAQETTAAWKMGDLFGAIL